jgi:hypothetical protein
LTTHSTKKEPTQPRYPATPHLFFWASRALAHPGNLPQGVEHGFVNVDNVSINSVETLTEPL